MLPNGHLSRAVRGTDSITVLLERIPRRLIEEAKAKCRSQVPPMALKWKIVELLQEFVNG